MNTLIRLPVALVGGVGSGIVLSIASNTISEFCPGVVIGFTSVMSFGGSRSSVGGMQFLEDLYAILSVGTGTLVMSVFGFLLLGS